MTTPHMAPRAEPMAGSRVDLIAVYGTLMAGLGAQERLGVTDQLARVGPCVLEGTLAVLGWYPGLLAEPKGRVLAELFRILDDQVLARLDRYEGPQYRRVQVDTIEPGDRAWVYVFEGSVPSDRHIASGDWRRYLDEDESADRADRDRR